MKKKFSEKEIFDIWNKEINSFGKKEMFNIYVENPFCPNQCLYCKHMGNYIRNHTKECKNYYEKILLNQISFF
jgi:coproporphyrinogen III oxidase-like Fe-S oxidoreductase